MSHDHDSHASHGIRGYIVVALILAVITYVEFAIIEYPIPWLGPGAILFWLIALSLAKFVMVIAYFMHLKDDDATYTGFFTSGMVIGMGTFVAFTFLMTLPASLPEIRQAALTVSQPAHGEADDHGGGYGDAGVDEATLAKVETDGYSRPLADVLRDGPPKNQTLRVTPPPAAREGWTVSLATPAFGAARAEAAPSEEAAPTDADEAVADADAATTDEAAQATEVATFDPAAAEAAYAANCASCHQANGAGLPGAFPPLAEHMPTLVEGDAGREYVIAALLYGLQGEIEVQGMTYAGVMPAWGYLGDDVIANTLNHASTAWGNDAALPDDFTPFTADEVAAQRDAGLTADDVYALRSALDLP
ncbi:MAG: cytochrome C oxidase subunit IV family protein [Trueperaceae bacterium]|nr:cytochrome C oxidase subunit IV family protein [Trueperaceae bacterium]